MTTLSHLQTEAESAVSKAESLEALEQVRVTYLGKSGSISLQMSQIGKLPPEERKTFGAEVNKVKEAVTSHLEARKAALEEATINARLSQETVDVTLPVREEARGSIHPISQVIEEITAIFARMGFTVAEGPDVESDFYNFTALNIDEDHPARQMHDTFYMAQEIEGKRPVLRTHTSPVQIRTMQNGKPPFTIIAPGRTYRCDSDQTHTPMFHQVEGLYIAKDIHMGHLKGCITEFLSTFFGVENLPVRFRASFFPFTEPSAEVDIGCARGKDSLKIGAGDDWLEVMGCGMVHPNVLKNVGLDPREWQGFALGMGVERLAMLKYGIPDLRTFFDSDVRWLSHYGFRALDIPSLVKGVAA